MANTRRSSIFLTTGEAGTGKSYKRGARFVLDFLEKEKGVLYSNFPLYPEVIAKFLSKKTGQPEQHYIDRIVNFSEEELNLWMGPHVERPTVQQKLDVRGPWSYFKGKNIQGAHIAIDECHNFCNEGGSTTPKYVRTRWSQWLGEIRHKGATVEFLTQHAHKLAKEITAEAETRVQLINPEHDRDPIFQIQMHYWYELMGIVTKTYERRIHEVHLRCLMVGGASRWVECHRERFLLDPFYFQFYDSYNRPVAEDGEHSIDPPKHECEKRSRLGLVFWFIKENPISVISRLVVIIFFISFFGFGLHKKMLPMVTGVFAKATGNMAPKTTPSAAKSIVSGSLKKTKSRSARPKTTNFVFDPNDPNIAKFIYQKPKDKKFNIVLMTRTTITLSDGYTYQVHEKIKHGDYKNETIRAIDYKNRTVYLTNDLSFRM